MDKQDIKVGRGGQFRLVDLQLDGPTRISRVHARIRRDDQGRFFIKDLSEWGTTVNGQQIARGVIREGEEVREIDVESELPTRARIGLADAVYLEFTAAPAPATATATASTAAATTTAMRTERVRDEAVGSDNGRAASAEHRPASGGVVFASDALDAPDTPAAFARPAATRTAIRVERVGDEVVASDNGGDASAERPISGAVVFASDMPDATGTLDARVTPDALDSRIASEAVEDSGHADQPAISVGAVPAVAAPTGDGEATLGGIATGRTMGAGRA